MIVRYLVLLCRVSDLLIFLSYPIGQLITDPAEFESYLDISVAIIKERKMFILH